jgi:uncharacterized damage-inducible protein DinB
MGLLDRLLGHDAWTTRQLLEISAELTDEQLDQEFDIGHRTVRKTFDHIVWNIECWTDLMKARTVRPRSNSNSTMTSLVQRHEAASAEFLTFAREITDQDRLDEKFTDSLDKPPREKSFGGAIVHLATHGMHHRAQLLFMLRRWGVTSLPEGDVLSWEDQRRHDKNL